jgi:hypothetical protein
MPDKCRPLGRFFGRPWPLGGTSSNQGRYSGIAIGLENSFSRPLEGTSPAWAWLGLA